MKNANRWILLVLLAFSMGSAQAQQVDDWPMKAHDVRRTGQSLINGPQSIDSVPSWTVELPGAHTINIGAMVTAKGVFFGSWGLLRRDPTQPGDPRTWDKADGVLYGLDPDTGTSLWGGPLELDLVPRCYEYPGRGPNLLWCGFTPYEVSFYNGTVEGQAAFDAARNVLYVGRGDGKLFAIDPDTGQILWRYVTFNPQLPDDPDGGGEVVTSPLLGPDGTVYFGTWGEGDFETHAFYAVNPDGSLQWRYPTNTSLTHRIFASPALSPDASTIYVSSFRDDEGTTPATLYAFHRQPTGAVADAQRLKWSLALEHNGKPVHTATLAVGSDGTVYVGGFLVEGFGVPVVVAVQDQGDAPALKWATPYVELRDGAQFVLGLALRETGGTTQRIYTTTANLGTALFNAKEEGALYAIDPGTGAVLASYDPSDDVPGAVGGINSPAIGADGTVYFGVRGRFGNNARNGHYFAVTYDANEARFTRRWNVKVDGYVEWNHPAIGPDGGIYVGSSSQNEQARAPTYDEGTTPEGTTAYFHALKGPTLPVSVEAQTPTRAFRLAPAYPNPFTEATTMLVEMARPGTVYVAVFDLLGRQVRLLHAGFLTTGSHTFAWDGTDSSHRSMAGGVYVAQVQTEQGTATRSLVLLHR